MHYITFITEIYKLVMKCCYLITYASRTFYANLLILRFNDGKLDNNINLLCVDVTYFYYIDF